MNFLKNYLNDDVISGLLLIFFAILALIASNSEFAPMYQQFFDINFSVAFNGEGLSKPILLWINDGLMAIFFLLIGLEIKREFLLGQLSDYKNAVLPVAGAIGGMVVPALVFYGFTYDDSTISHAWAIPVATDIAFALGALALFGPRVPSSLRLFLLTLAIIDDLGAILIIGYFHTSNISVDAMTFAATSFVFLVILNYLKVGRITPYLIIGGVMWFGILKSGLHPTMAGVLLAFTIPIRSRTGKDVLLRLEESIQPFVSYFILPLFAFANAGVPLADFSLASLQHPLILAIVSGLVVGKIVGICGFTVLTQKLFRFAPLFSNLQLLGLAALCGIGFTMSLFIAGLSFSDTQELLNYSRAGILLGSFVSMAIGASVLHYSLPKSRFD